MPNKENITAVVGSKKGSIWTALVSDAETIPTDATTVLGEEFKCLGYISSDGVTESDGATYTQVTAWCGEIVDEDVKREATKQFTLIEYLNAEVLKTVFGSANVKVGSGGKVESVTIKDGDIEPRVFIFEQILKDGKLERDIIPCGYVTAVADRTHNESNSTGYQVTVTCSKDASGNRFYKYFSL